MKSKARIELFKNEAPCTSFPHNCNNLVGSIVYFSKTFKSCSVVNELYKDDAASVSVLQEIFSDSTKLKVLKSDFAYINVDFIVSWPITELEKTVNLLSETVK
jgi:hypothetical protein